MKPSPADPLAARPRTPLGSRSDNPGPVRRPLRAGLPALLLAAFLLPAPGAGADGRESAHRATHLLEYVAIDYPVAVQDGRVASELEYREQLEFVAQVGSYLAALGVRPDDPLRADLAALENAVAGRAPSERVTAQARALAAGIGTRFGVEALPPRAPSLARGRALYAAACVSCHGPEGRGDGPGGAELDPRPSNLTDRERMLALSPFALYSTISFGVDGTGMAGFADRFDETARHDLAFFVGSLAFHADEIARGRALAQGNGGSVTGRVPDLATLVQRSANDLASDPEGLALVAYLRSHPEALGGGEAPLAVARGRLLDSWRARSEGDRERAVDLAIAAYLDGYEPAEPALSAVHPRLHREIESGFLRYRALLREDRPLAEVEPVFAALDARIARAEAQLEEGDLGRATLFVSSLVILAREGLEALLIVVALSGLLVRAGRRDALRYVHGGWLAALAAGAGTWFAARELVRISGAEREVIEGLSSLLASAILFYVSCWLLSKVEAGRWQAFLASRVRGALSRGSLWVLASISFVAVYREIFETLLFYQALWAQAGPAGTSPILVGASAGALLLAAIAIPFVRFGFRLPMRRFFAASSALLFGLAVVMAGQGIAALQEVGWIATTRVRALRVEWLGIHPTAEGLALQSLLLLAACVTIAASFLARRSPAGEPAPQTGS